MNREYFAKRLKELRKLHGETQKDLANAVFVSETSIQNYEYMLHLPTVEILCSIALHYGVSIDSLLFENRKTVDDRLLEIRKLTYM